MLYAILLWYLLLPVDSQRGPGNGPWKVVTPETHGLSRSDLKTAATNTFENMGSRQCFVVVKNGDIVFEEYYNGHSESATRAGWSTTKSHCGAMFGIAAQLGFANVHDKIADRNNNTRKCNSEATFKHVLSMTGQSRDINTPRFWYDALGWDCLDTLSDFIRQNNPDNLSTLDWKNRYWQNALGLEHTSWETKNRFSDHVQCGFSSYVSCRDLARTAQLWVNDGYWPTSGQMMSKQFAEEGRKTTFPSTQMIPYGYTQWLYPSDQVDNEVAAMNGAYSQCAFFSKKHNAIVVSMGTGDPTGFSCTRAWTYSRFAIVSDHLSNVTEFPEHHVWPSEWDEQAQGGAPARELLAIRDLVNTGELEITKEEHTLLNDWLRAEGYELLKA